ncbi:MAG: helix-turn-helix domain-containing protein [Kineosporiaceae bacterium]
MSATTAAVTGELLTIGQVASLLGVSRQHVVDLCMRGDLPFVSVAPTAGSSATTSRPSWATG